MMENRINEPQTSKGSSIFLTGAILFANLDYTGLQEYAIKAAIGGVIWMVFKLAGDYISEKMKSK
jgi:hypothetical protein